MRKVYVEKMQATHPSWSGHTPCVTTTHSWIAASPDDLVTDPLTPNPYEVSEYKTLPSAN